MGRVNTLALDKTGTITLGNPRISRIISLNEMSEREILLLAASAERFSEHPLARAILHKAREENIDLLEPHDFTVHMGMGISAFIDGKSVIIGGSKFLEQKKIEFKDEHLQTITRREECGKIIVSIAIDGNIAGIIGFKDTLREGIPVILKSLRQKGIKEIFMLTGDSKICAAKVSEELGIDACQAGLLPEEKSEFISFCRKKGLRIAMVGDGINDAPALAAANVGIAMGTSGTDLAVESAKIVLMDEKLEKNTLSYNPLQKGIIYNTAEYHLLGYIQSYCYYRSEYGVDKPDMGCSSP